MPAYWLARSRINDPVEYKKYTDQVPQIIAAYGAKVLARGGPFKILEGPEHFGRFVVIEFPTMQAAIDCHDSQAYQDASAYRKRNGVGEVELVILEAGEATR